MHGSSRRRRAFTMLELAVVLILAAVAAVLLLPALGRTKCGARGMKDASQIRGVMQGLVVWAQNNKDSYPLPSALDLDNTTTSEQGRAKDHTANILSLLIYNGFVPVDLLVSPAEANPNIEPFANYQFGNPQAAADPSKALWDPAFSVDFIKGKGGTSYAHLQPTTPRIDTLWKPTFNASEAVLGNRGPQVTAVQATETDVTVTVANPDSVTNLIHGSRTSWEGHIGFNDNHVDSLMTLDWNTMQPKPTYLSTSGKRLVDVAFFDEPDDAEGTNSFLGIFTTAGEQPQDWTAIWD